MSRTATIRVLDEVYMTVTGLHGDHLIHFYDKYAIHAANYFFNPKFKLGQWDGKLRYFHKDGKTYFYLLEEILPQLQQFGYTIELIDNREVVAYQPEFIDANVFAHINHLDSGKPIILRDYQVDAVNSLIESGTGLCIAGTGSGKTLATAALCFAYNTIGVKSITIVPGQTLIKQTKRDFINCGLDTGEYSGDQKTLNHKHIISTWQALQNNPKIMTQFNMVVIDECHGLRATQLQKLVCDYAGQIPYRFGFTGTLPKDPSEKMLVHVAAGPIRYEIPAHELIDRGVLSTLQIDIIQMQEDLTKEYDQFKKEIIIGKIPSYKEFKDGYFADYSAEKSYIQRRKQRIEWVSDLIMTKLDTTGNVLCLVDNIQLGRKIAALIPGAIFINGKDVKAAKKRQETYELFKTRDDLIVIATVNIAGTGLSIDRIFNLITLDIGKSYTRVIQAIGRGLRKADDKHHVSYTDICSDLKYGKKHLGERISYYKESHYPYKKYTVDYNKDIRDATL
jgi:superfamily II DNA or RNA helicase